MRKSNKVLLAFSLSTVAIYMLLLFSFKSEYRRSAIRNISDNFSVVVVEDNILQEKNIVLTEATSVDDSYVYFEQGGFRKAPLIRYSNDTLIIRNINHPSDLLNKEKLLKINLKGIEKIVFNGQAVGQ